MNTSFHETIIISLADGVELSGDLYVPKGAESLVLFSHGSGSSRLSPRNAFVANELHQQKIATFLFDLLTVKEDQVYSNRFDIDLLAERLIQVTKFISTKEECRDLSLGFFGASTGAASAFKVAALLPDLIHAVVSRGGRPDLVKSFCARIKAPTLLIVGELDRDVLKLNQDVFKSLICLKKLEIVKDATHLFEEQGALQQVAFIATNWFKKYLKSTVHI